MESFSESNYTFTFDKHWKVVKYDDHPYFRILSGRSFSGVDFVGIYRNEKLYILEIKNYYQYSKDGVIEDLDQFVSEIRGKMLDTLDLMRIIHKYHSRKLMFRFCIDLVNKLPSLHYTWWIWNRMKDLESNKDFVFILLINSKEPLKTLSQKLNDKIAEEQEYQIPEIEVFDLENYNLPGVQISPM